MQVSAVAILTYFLIYSTLALKCAPKKHHFLIYGTLALLCTVNQMLISFELKLPKLDSITIYRYDAWAEDSEIRRGATIDFINPVGTPDAVVISR